MNKLNEAIEQATNETDEAKTALLESVELLRNEMNMLLRRLHDGKPFNTLNAASQGGEVMRLGATYQERLDALTRLHEIRGGTQ
ncbi:hypothetical protein WMF38_57320 [Sorangium sp. So ce118]